MLVPRRCIDDHVFMFLAQHFASRLAGPQNPRTFKAMSFLQELSQATAQARCETEHLVDPLVAKAKERFKEACRKAAQNEKNECQIFVGMSEEVKKRAGGMNVTERKLWAMLVELGLNGISVERMHALQVYFKVSAKWPVADAASSKEPSPERASGTCITCPICQEHRPAVVLMPCGHVVCRNCQRCQQLHQCPMCRGPISSASDGLFMD